MPAYLLTIGLIISFVLVLLIMLVLLVSYHDMVKKFRYSQRENTFLKNHVHEQSMEVLDSARSKALALLEEAEQKASEIIKSANTYEDQANSLVAKTLTESQKQQARILEDTTNMVLKTYTTDLKSVEETNVKTLQSLTESFETQTKTDLHHVQEILSKEAAASEKVLTQQVSAAEEAAEKEIATYKQQMLAKVDERILGLLSTVAKDVFGKTLSLDEHQQIVIASLEAAKKDILKN